MNDFEALAFQYLSEAPYGVAVLGDDGKVLFLNEYGGALLRVAPKAVKGRSFHALVHGTKSGSNHTASECVFGPRPDKAKVFRENDFFLGKGNGVFVRYQLRSFTDSLLRIVEFRETAEIQPNEAKESLLRRQFVTVFEHASQALLFIDDEGLIETANQAARELLGQADLSHVQILRLLPQSQRAHFKTFFRKTAEQPAEEVFVFDQGAEQKHYKFRITPIEVNARSVVIEDVSAVLKQERRLEHYATVVGHELKTPLAVIKAYAQLAARRLKSEGNMKVLSYVDTIEQRADELTQLITSMMDETKLQAGKLPFEDETLEFDVLIREGVDDIQRTLSSHLLLVEGGSGALVRADRDRVTQVLTELVRNAATYSKEKKKIVIKIGATEALATVEVQDFGVGLKQSEQEHLFEPFFRSKTATLFKTPGLGLGLYISKRIIEHYDGTMWVKSSYRKGSLFGFGIPRLAARAT